MNRTLLKISTIGPIVGMLLPMIAGWLTPGYSSISQHMSELEMISGAASIATRTGSLISGFTIVLFGIALLAARSRRMPFTAGAALIFGVSMISNGVFTMGSPLHGLYAIGLSNVLTPALFAAERQRDPGATDVDLLSLTASVLSLVYMWALITGVEPVATHGLTQRLACIPLFGWYSYASMKLLDRPCKNAVTKVRFEEA